MKFSQPQLDPVIKQLIGDLICVRFFFLNLKSLLNSQQTQNYAKIIYSLIRKLSNRPDVIITDGKNPVLWYINGLQGITETPNSQKIVDTTGAGDAFLAGLISKLISSGYPSNELEIEDCIRFAGVCGLLTCLGEGAIEQQPYYEKVNKFLGSLIS